MRDYEMMVAQDDGYTVEVDDHGYIASGDAEALVNNKSDLKDAMEEALKSFRTIRNQNLEEEYEQWLEGLAEDDGIITTEDELDFSYVEKVFGK